MRSPPGAGCLACLALLVLGIACAARAPEAEAVRGRGTAPVFDVTAFGAVGDGATDDAGAIQRALDAAAAHAGRGAVVHVPQHGNSTYMLHMGLQVRCNHTTLLIDGRLTLPSRRSLHWPVGSNPHGSTGANVALLRVARTVGVTVRGKGTLFGAGDDWWVNANVTPAPPSCFQWHTLALPSSCAPALLVVNQSTGFTLSGLLLQRPPGGHIGLHGATNVLLENFAIDTPGHAADTDGIDTTHVDHLTIRNCSISNGDDNIAIKNATSNVLVEGCYFGTGHGASIGSIPRDGFRGWRGVVANVTLRGLVMNGTVFGVRIKTWQNATGHVSNVTYEDLRLIDVGTAVQLNAYYCQPTYCPGPLLPLNQSCCGPRAMAHVAQNVAITGLTLRRISGTAGVAGSLQCSAPPFQCRRVAMEDVDIAAAAGFSCSNAAGSARNVTPRACLA